MNTLALILVILALIYVLARLPAMISRDRAVYRRLGLGG